MKKRKKKRKRRKRRKKKKKKKHPILQPPALAPVLTLACQQSYC